jgi:UDP-N-acetylmuramoylalanine--D-glutamate ligase
MSFQSAIDALTRDKKKVLVVGLGISGIESSKFLVRHGLGVVLAERQSEELFLARSKFAPAVGELRALGVEIRFGVEGESLVPHLGNVGLAIVSPGVPLESAVIGTISRLKIPYVSELELGIELHGGKSVVVTGSNGKSTTVSLIDHILSTAGMRSYLCGNVGTPVISSEELHSEEVSDRSLLVVEASSYQLEACTVLKPSVAVILNLSENHLERHGSMERYGAAKGRVLKLQGSEDLAVINADDPAVMNLARSCRATIGIFGTAPLAQLAKMAPIAASIDERAAGGAVVSACINGEIESYETRECALLGAHNRHNMAAAILAARRCGASAESVQRGLNTFAPLEHRLEVIHRTESRIIINDSKSTTVAASLAAFRTVHGHFPEHRLIVMLGGLSKAGSWDPLLTVIKSAAAGVEPVVCFGKDGSLLAGHCRAHGIACEVAPTLRDATQLALKRLSALPNGIVLLTPGCASFDEFTDFEHRGTQFKLYVKEAQGLPLSA